MRPSILSQVTRLFMTLREKTDILNYHNRLVIRYGMVVDEFAHFDTCNTYANI